MPTKLPQVTILHFSDLHFGAGHRFTPLKTPSGDPGSRAGVPTLAEKLVEDLADASINAPILVCITGDIATTGSYDELLQLDAFLKTLEAATIFGRRITRNDVFIVPGNHDLLWTEKEIPARWREWITAYQRWFGTPGTTSPYDLVRVHDRIETHGVVLVTLNSAILVQEKTEDQNRGSIEERQIESVVRQLEAIPRKRLTSAIRVALMHHHPVLIPPMAEPGRKYDAILNSGRLLTYLRQFGFHLILHGHKHDPYVFTDDTRPGFGNPTHQPMLIVAGGSAGSRELPDRKNRANTYNKIAIKWHEAAAQWRIHVETRRLVIFDNAGDELLAARWYWETLDEDDRSFYGNKRLPPLRVCDEHDFDTTHADTRAAEYARTRGNMAIVEVIPSLLPDQAYEARVWVIPHNRRPEDEPISVTWSAGKNFRMLRISHDQDPHFCAMFSYWGPMLIQGRLTFATGDDVNLFAYARIPEGY